MADAITGAGAVATMHVLISPWQMHGYTQENERLMDLLGKLDQDRSALEADNNRMHAMLPENPRH